MTLTDTLRVARSLRSVVALALLLSAASAASTVPVAGGSPLVPIAGMELLPVLQRAQDVGPADPNQSLVVAVSLSFAQPAAMQAFVDDVSNPKSPDYRKFIGPDEVGARFGQPLERVDAIAAYLEQNGLVITEIGKNRLAVVARGTVAQAEQAFHTTIRSWKVDARDSNEPGEFIAPATLVRLPADLASDVIDVSGLDTYVRPRPMTTLLTPFLSRSVYNAQPIFGAGLTGAGRTVGVTSFDGFRASNWLLYISHFALPTPVGGPGTNITVVPVGGGGVGAGPASGEGDLDIQMVLGAAPLASIRIYDPSIHTDLVAVLSAEASDDQCDAITDSYTWALPNTAEIAAHNQHLSMNAEGITYMNASGDEGTNLDSFGYYPDCDPEVLSVGGTIADVDPVTGARLGETNWGFGGGGWSTNTVAFNVRPPWQTGTGVPAINAVNDHRLVPDLAFHSSSGSFSGAYEFYANNALTKGTGTSFAAPVFAGQLQLVSLEVIGLGGLVPDINGHRRFGRIQDLIYSQDNDPAIWFDITSGSNNGFLPAGQGLSAPHVGWDTCVGWGPMNEDAFASAVVCVTGGCASTPWTDLGSGLAGVTGAPDLVGAGTLVGGSPGNLALTAARPLSPALLFVSFSSTPVPFKGGTLVAFPFVLTVSLGTDALGALTLPFTFPSGVPSATSLFFQYAVQDAAAPHGASLSNAEHGVTP